MTNSSQAINSWVRNGHENNWETIDYDLTDPTDFDDLVSGDLFRVAGVVKINVCSLQEIYDTVDADPENSKGTLNFPCPG